MYSHNELMSFCNFLIKEFKISVKVKIIVISTETDWEILSKEKSVLINLIDEKLIKGKPNVSTEDIKSLDEDDPEFAKRLKKILSYSPETDPAITSEYGIIYDDYQQNLNSVGLVLGGKSLNFSENHPYLKYFKKLRKKSDNIDYYIFLNSPRLALHDDIEQLHTVSHEMIHIEEWENSKASKSAAEIEEFAEFCVDLYMKTHNKNRK